MLSFSVYNSLSVGVVIKHTCYATYFADSYWDSILAIRYLVLLRLVFK